MTTVKRTDEEQAEMVRSLRARLPQLQREADEIRERLRAILRIVPTTELLARLFDRTIREAAAPDGSGDIEWVKMEYVSWLALREPAPLRLDVSILDETVTLTYDLLTDAMHNALWRGIAAGDPSDATLSAQFHARANELAVRGDGYPVHVYPTLRRLFEPVSGDLARLFGFDANDLITCVRAIEDWLTQQTIYSIEGVDAIATMMAMDAVGGRKEQVIAQGFDAGVIESVAAMDLANATNAHVRRSCHFLSRRLSTVVPLVALSDRWTCGRKVRSRCGRALSREHARAPCLRPRHRLGEGPPLRLDRSARAAR